MQKIDSNKLFDDEEIQRLKKILDRSEDADISKEDKLELFKTQTLITLLKIIAYPQQREKVQVIQEVIEKTNSWLQNIDCSEEDMVHSLLLRKLATATSTIS